MRKWLLVFLFSTSIPLWGQHLTLPFFDDFSSPKIDPSRWIVGGVERTEGKAILPPSLGVVTFDGRTAQGQPYRSDRVDAVGPTDTLTSRSFALSQFSPQDSVFLRFFVQPNGLGEAPDPEDSLWVEVKNDAGNWQSIWRIQGGDIPSTFVPVSLPITQRSWLYDGFQFRFRASGRQSGPFDAWHVDYLFMHARGTSGAQFYPDIAFVETPKSLLKEFRGVPFRSFQRNPNRFWADSLQISVRNLRQFLSFTQATFELEGPNTQLRFTPPDFQNIPGNRLVQLRFPRPSTWVIPQPGRYTYRVLLDTPESNVLTQPDFSVNDSHAQTLSIQDTWHYDDGSAEGGADIDRRLGQVAQLFKIDGSDTLGGVQIAFSPTFASLVGRSLLVRVWDATPQGPGTLLNQELIRLTSDSVWIRFIFKQSILVPSQFFVGWQRLSDQVVPVGLDKNTIPPADRIWSSTGLAWQPTALPGTLMLRAIMGKLGQVPPSFGTVTQIPVETEVRIFPNPARDWIHWTPQVGEFRIQDATGRLWATGHAEQGAYSISTWPIGTYFLTIVTKTHTFTQKWVIDR